jgi:hypothetical protein
MDQITLRRIGCVFSPGTEAVDDFWGNLVSTIELDRSILNPEHVQGFSDFSHLIVV